MSPALTLFGHLDELRKRLLVSFAAVLVSMAGAFFYSDRLLAVLVRPLLTGTNEVYFFSPAEAFAVKLKMAFLAGLVIASPVVMGQLWLFISPALYEREKRLMVPVIFLTSFLFLAGVLFCFFFVMPSALKFLMGMQTEFLKPMISVSEYVGFLSMMLLAFGAAFNLPVFIMALVFLGLLDSKTLNRYQRHAVLLIFIAAAVMTPGPDIVSQLLLAVPLVLLFELSVLGAKAIEVVRRKQQKVLNL